jgi:hypothetical protein
MSWATTKWGLVCRAVADEFVAAYPQFSIGIGPDPESLKESGYRVTFVVLDGSLTDPRYAGDDETHGTFDEELPIRINIHVPTNLDTSTNYDNSPDLLELAKERILEAIDSVRHTPYFTPRSIARRGGRINADGSEIIIVAMMRIENFRTLSVMATPLAMTIGLTVEGPDGNGDSIEVIGEP